MKPEIASDEQTIARFSSELKLARKISHKSVCRMFDISEEEGMHYITMEYVSGEDLKSMLRMVGRLSPGQAVPIAKQVCEGLAEAHRLGIVHRDLKPSNIMIDREGQVKIMDFGIARSVEAKGITGTGLMIGTPEYMSPEQVEGKDVDQRSDVYALGIILYEMLTGRVPFEGDTALSIALKHKTEVPEDPAKINPQIPRDLRFLVLRCLEKSKERRYQNAEEVLAEFLKIEQGIPTAEKVLPKRKAITSKEITQTIKNKWRLAAAIAAVAILAVFAVLYLIKEKPVPSSGKKKLAVLPFENIGPPEDEYFADGITDEIIARLANVTDLSIISRNSSIQYKKTIKSIQQIGEELGVDFVLSGTIRWQKPLEGVGRVRVTPTLIKVSDSTHIWANVYDESISEIFQVQSDISRKVVEALGIALLEPERGALEARPTQNMEAYEYYLRGNDYWRRGREDEREFRLGIEMYERAVSLDQNFYQAYAYLARAQASYYWFYFDHSSERVAKAKEAVDKASQINPEAPEVHVAQGYYYYHCKLDYEQALNHFAKALEKQPKNTAILEGLAYVERRQGRMDEAVAHLTLASEIDPRSSSITFNLSETHALLRNYQEAEKWYDRALFLQPKYERAFSWKTRLFINQGDIRKARQVLEEASQTLGLVEANFLYYHWVLVDIVEEKYEEAIKRLASVSLDAFSDQFYFVPKASLYAQIYGLMNNLQLEKSHYESAVKFLEGKIKEDPQDSRYWSSLGIAYAGLGRKNDAIRAAEKATEILPISKEAYRGTFRAADLAQVFTMVGEYDKAFELIEYLLSIPGEMSIPLLKIDPVWAPLRFLPRFQKLVDKFQL
jgi:serine/threonine protein kinase/tetratricopeptide (TPR) repeat protein